MSEYAGRLPLFHIDLYRLDDGVDAVADGLLDERQAAGVSLVEWAERMGPVLPAGAPRHRRSTGAADEPRTIELIATGPDHGRYLAVDAVTAATPTPRDRHGDEPHGRGHRAAGCAGRPCSAWPAGQRHGEELLAGLDRLLRRRGR